MKTEKEKPNENNIREIVNTAQKCYICLSAPNQCHLEANLSKIIAKMSLNS